MWRSAALAVVLLAVVVGHLRLSLWYSETDLSTYLREWDEDEQRLAHLTCLEPPLCGSPRLSLQGSLACHLRSFPLAPDTAAYRQYARQRLHSVVPRVVLGQHAVGAVIAAVERKLRHPYEPLVMHFAGDNGVGKTRTAEALSVALALRCANAACALGDSTLVLSGTAYDGLSLLEFRRSIVPIIAAHARRFRRNGVLIINELSSLEHGKVQLLMPVLGRGGCFPEYPGVDLAALIVIITTDFGQEGRTQGRSMEEMRIFINKEFQHLYSRSSTSNIRTFPFLPISLQTAADIVRASVLEMGCGACRRPVAISTDAVHLLVERVKPMLAGENGRAVVQQAAESVGPVVDLACIDTDGSSASAYLRVELGDDGELAVVPSSTLAGAHEGEGE